jgi:hypothetical protein
MLPHVLYERRRNCPPPFLELRGLPTTVDFFYEPPQSPCRAPQGRSTQQWSLPDWSQMLFASSIPRKFEPMARLWLLIRGVTLWCIWISRNHFVFTQSSWHHEYFTDLICLGISEYAKAAWNKVQATLVKNPVAAPKLLKRIDSEWGRFQLICSRQGRLISWGRHNPCIG